MGSAAYQAGIAEYIVQVAKRDGKSCHHQFGLPKPEKQNPPACHAKLASISVKEESVRLPSVMKSQKASCSAGKMGNRFLLSSASTSETRESNNIAATAVPQDTKLSPPCVKPATKKKESFSKNKPSFPGTFPVSDSPFFKLTKQPSLAYSPCNNVPPQAILVFVAIPSAVLPPAQMKANKVKCFQDGAEHDLLTFPGELQVPSGFPNSDGAFQKHFASPWTLCMMEGFPPDNDEEPEFTGNGNGNGNYRGGNGDGDNGEGDDEWEDEEDEDLPGLTLGFALLQFGYCVAVHVQDDGFDREFAKKGLAFFGLLAFSAIRMSSGVGMESYIIGLCASLGVMLWSGERAITKKELTPAGLLAVMSAIMSCIFSSSLLECVELSA